MKILLVFGTRPEAIKMCPLYNAFKSRKDVDCRVAVTAQHRQMLDQVLDVFSVAPSFDLDLMSENQSLHGLAASALLGLQGVYESYKPDLVFVHGDTTSALMASIAAYYARVPVAHVEAGLRTSDIYSPWPEEGNRKAISSISTLHFAPTENSALNLQSEGVPEDKVFITGNTVVDAVKWMSGSLQSSGQLQSHVRHHIGEVSEQTKLVLVTGHRRENFGRGFAEICEALVEVAQRKPDVQIVYPLHLNPNVKKPVESALTGISNIKLIEPVDYPTFVALMLKSSIILTDSGGIQEEAPALGKPVLLMRDTSERPEALEAGGVKLVGARKIGIVNGVLDLLDNESLYRGMSTAGNPYGDGDASEKIVNYTMEYLNGYIEKV